MSTFYVNKSGDDANDGLTVDTAKLTIKAGMNLFVSGDTDYVVVGSGLYNEGDFGVFSKTGNKTFYADGDVVVDGTGTSGTMWSGSTSGTKYWKPYTTNGGTWTFQNAPTGSSRYIQPSW